MTVAASGGDDTLVVDARLGADEADEAAFVEAAAAVGDGEARAEATDDSSMLLDAPSEARSASTST